MGYVMVFMCNEGCVYECKGVYDNIIFYDGLVNMGVVVNFDIDLCFFMNEWVYVLVVSMDWGKMGMLYGL